MGLRHPHQRRAQRRGLGGIDGDADPAVADIERMYVVEAPFAADHDRQPCGEGGLVIQCAVHIAAVAAVEQFQVAIDRICDVDRLGRPGVGGVGIEQAAIGTLGPYRPGRRGDEAAEHLGLFQQRLVAEVGLGQLPAHPGKFPKPHNGLSADGATHGLDGAPVRGGQIEQEALAGFAQGVDRVIDLQCRFRWQPGSEREDALRQFLRHQKGGVAADLRTVVAGGPGDQNLGFGEQQRAEAVGLTLQALNFGAQPHLACRRADPRTHEQDSRHDRKAEQRQRRRQRRDLLVVQIEEGGDGAQDRQIACMGRPDRDQRGGADGNSNGNPKGNQAVARQ